MQHILWQQLEYYRARAGEYDEWFLRQGRYDRGPALNAQWFAEVETVAAALDAFRPAGDVLELACGTGLWTARLLAHAARVTAVDAAPEVQALNRARLADLAPLQAGAAVTYVEADLFAWEPPASAFDVVFFSFWLSHVPPERFDAFWALVRQALRPGGRFFLLDSRHEPTSTAVDHRLPERIATTLTRRLNDGREFEIVKVFYEPDPLRARLGQLGWVVETHQTPTYFLFASGSRAPVA
jgi:demethylmenaquinone methyltransferase/2-methoxy-6-polyprenyl-1,4-benzoquinol methylase